MPKPVTETDFLALVEKGLGPSSGPPRKVIVIGGGMAGLVASYELARAGHEPFVLEARSRVGGRVYTMREPFAPGLHAEIGAMRLPLSHRLTMAYVQRFGLKTYPFTLSNPRAYLYLHGRRYRRGEARPEDLGFQVAPHQMGKGAAELVAEILRPLHEKLTLEGEDAWTEIVVQYDHYSLREFLEAQTWPEEAIEMVGVMSGVETRMNDSFIEFLRGTLDFGGALVQVEGGTDNLPNAFLPHLKGRVRLGARVTQLEQTPEKVVVHFITAAGHSTMEGDYAILTLPFAVLRHIEVSPAFSRPKQRAIRQLNYDASTKIFFQCSRRFWEEDEDIHGGGTLTDLAVRNIYYPEHGMDTGRGVILASYTWGQDAMRWGALDPEERIRQAIENMAEIHPQILDTFEVGASYAWHDDEFAGGVGALFDPGQETLLRDAINQPEGRYFFAGEHTSIYRRWIQGAVESGLRAAWEVCNAKETE
jgi:monoamine oxidase